MIYRRGVFLEIVRQDGAASRFQFQAHFQNKREIFHFYENLVTTVFFTHLMLNFRFYLGVLCCFFAELC